MSDTVSGLLSQKPNSPYGEPNPGDTRRFSVEPRPKKSGEGTWNKIKNEGEGFGDTYKIIEVERKSDYDGGHGILRNYSLLLKPIDGEKAVEGGGAVMGEPAPPKVFVGGTDRDEAISIAVAFKGAVELACARIQSKDLPPEGVSDYIEMMTNLLLPVVKGQSRVEGN